MPRLHFFASLLFIIATVFGQDDPSIIDLTDSQPNITWRASDESSIKVTAEPGYQIEVKISAIDLDGENGDYVTVKVSADDDEDIEDSIENALMFSYTVPGEPTYLYNHHQVEANYVGTSDSSSFEIQFTRVGEAISTTPELPSTTTTPAMPTAAPEESATLTRYLSGWAIDKYSDNEAKETLQNTIASMGIEYCKDQSCPLNSSEPITSNNVKIVLIEACPLLWENYDTCANLTFAFPIVKVDDGGNSGVWGGYQLSTKNLKIMWDDYAPKYLTAAGLNVYEVPNVKKILTGRLIVFCLVIVSLVIMIVVARAILNRINKKRRKYSDTVSIMRESVNMPSQLLPHYLQEMPSLFGTDFPMFPDQSQIKPYADFNNSFEEEVEPPAALQPKLVNIASNDSIKIENSDA